MTATPRRDGAALLHLVDRVARRNILPAEIRALRDGVAALAEANAQLASLSVNAARALADERRHHEIAAEEVARLRGEARIALRDCLMPGCMRQFDVAAHMEGRAPARPEWSGDRWQMFTGLLPGRDYGCSEHAPLIARHMTHIAHADGLTSAVCACRQWTATRRWHGAVRALWEEHLLDAAALPAPDTEEPT